MAAIVDPNGIVERISKRIIFDSYEKLGLIEVTETEPETFTVLAWFDGETRVRVDDLSQDGTNGCVEGLAAMFKSLGYGFSINLAA